MEATARTHNCNVPWQDRAMTAWLERCILAGRWGHLKDSEKSGGWRALAMEGQAQALK